MAKNKTSKFAGSADGLGLSPKTQEVQETQHVQHVQDEKKRAIKQDKNENPHREYGSTQGRKGQHAKRINMAFSDDNHEYITKESRRQGMSATAFVNMIIDEYKS